jgi:hypothetical protein
LALGLDTEAHRVAQEDRLGGGRADDLESDRAVGETEADNEGDPNTQETDESDWGEVCTVQEIGKRRDDFQKLVALEG